MESPPLGSASPSEGLGASVLVCTYNRCGSLLDTLRALGKQAVREDTAWEIVVVDNNSADATRATVGHFAATHPGLRVQYVFEGEQGLSHARNKAISIARGDLLLFTDDDVLPASDWVQTMVDVMAQWRCDACGGYIEPIWEMRPPRWLTERFYGYLALKTDLDGPRLLGPSEDPPFGANMAFRRDVFQRVGLFDVSLGRKGSVLAGGEEWDLFRRVVQAGGCVLYAPHARVRHKVEAFRVRKRYFRRWRFQASRSLARRSAPAGERRVAGVPLYLFRQLVNAALKTMRYAVSRPADETFRQEIIVWHFLGLIAGARDRRVDLGKDLHA
jgi:glycosyltransferase involved in cell wall biosynthesis